MARGFIPDRLRSSRKTGKCGVTALFHSTVSGPLRSRSGMNPLTTKLCRHKVFLSDKKPANQARRAAESHQ